MARPAGPDRGAALHAAARRLETAFLAAMLKAAGIGRPLEGPGGGGIGEAQLASFQADALADALARRGGIGLAEALVRSLARHEDPGG